MAVNVVPIVDTSASMFYSGYVAITIIDTNAFIGLMQAGDGLGVVNYDVNGSTAFPFTTLSSPGSTGATAAVQGLSFSGNCTNIGGGIQAARGMLDSLTGTKRAAVLLTDGLHNCGTPPLGVLPSYPVYTCAMGPVSDPNLLQQIATQTGGKFYNAPYIYNMAQIYNQITQQMQPAVQMAYNQRAVLNQYGSQLIPITVSGVTLTGQFAVTWENASYAYTSSPNPSQNQISITIVDPSGTIVTNPSVVGAGYVVFDAQNPAQGTWYAQLAWGSGSGQLGVTTAAFEYGGTTNPIALAVDAPERVAAGEPLRYSAVVTDEGEPVEDADVWAEVEQPRLGVRTALRLYRHLMLPLGEDAHDEHDDEVGRLRALSRRLPAGAELLPRVSYPQVPDRGERGVRTGGAHDTSQDGTYIVRVHAKGYAPRSKTPFQRTQMIHVVVG